MAKQNNKKDKDTAAPREGVGLGFWIIGGLLFAGAVTGGVVLYNKNRKKKNEKGKEADFPEQSGGGSKPKPKPKSGSSSSSGGSRRNDNFPLKKGSKGPRVARVQNALIAKFGSGILPKYGADSDWGGETETALRSVGWPTVITAKTFSDFFGSKGSQPQGGDKGSGITNPHNEAWNLHQAAKKRDWPTVEKILLRMKTTADYVSIRTSFVTWPFWGSVNYSPVTALLRAFPQKAAELEAHFRRMGLVKRGSKWSLSGLGNLPPAGRMLRLRHEADIWAGDLSIRIPAGLVLGREVKTSGGFTLFENGNGQRYYVHTKDAEFA